MIPFDFSQIKDETIFTVFASLVTSFIVLFISNFFIYLKARRERQILKEIALLNFKNFLKLLYKQSYYFYVFQKALDVDKLDSTYVYKFLTSASLPILNTIGYEKLYNSFFSGWENQFWFKRRSKSLKAFNDLWSSIEYVNSTLNDSKVRANKFEAQNKELGELRNQSLSKIQLNIEAFRIRFVGQLGLNEPLGKFFNEREKIIEKHTSTPNYISPTNTENYVQALLALNRKNTKLLNRYLSDIKPVELNSDLNEASIRYQNLKTYFMSTESYFDNVSKKYFQEYNTAKKAIRTLY